MIKNYFNRMTWVREEAEALRLKMTDKWEVDLAEVKVNIYWREWTDGDEHHRGPLMWGVTFPDYLEDTLGGHGPYTDEDGPYVQIIGGEVKHALSDVVMNVEVTPELVESLREDLAQVQRTLRDMRR